MTKSAGPSISIFSFTSVFSLIKIFTGNLEYSEGEISLVVFAVFN